MRRRCFAHSGDRYDLIGQRAHGQTSEQAWPPHLQSINRDGTSELLFLSLGLAGVLLDLGFHSFRHPTSTVCSVDSNSLHLGFRVFSAERSDACFAIAEVC